MISYMDLIKHELAGIYGEDVLRDVCKMIKLYDIYDGKGQDWETPGNLDYQPTKKKTNYIKKLIKEEARFLFGKTPEFKVASKNEDAAAGLNTFLNETLKKNHFSEKIIKGARDCFIGKRVAMKIIGGKDRPLKINFVPSMGFVYEPIDDQVDELKSIVFFYAINDKEDKRYQRVWKQKFWLENGICRMDEGVYNGYGELVEKRYESFDTGLDFIPAKVIINDGLSGDLKGESDVEELLYNQEAFNRLSSDDIDALKFNMFPQTVAVNANRESLEKIKISPAALIDLQTDETVDDGQAQMYKLESSFSYDARLEHTLRRLKNEMHELLNIPNVSPEELKGFITSGKSMKALYWQMITRCEEKYATWRPALEWLGRSVIRMAQVYGVGDAPNTDDFTVSVENIYPLFDDELEEKSCDMQAVNTQTMSRKSYINKWNTEVKEDYADSELKQMRLEREMLEESYAAPVTAFE